MRYRNNRNTTEVTAAVSATLRALRIKRGLRITEVARSASLTRQALYKYETGRMNATVPLLFELAAVCNTSVAVIMKNAERRMSEAKTAAVCEYREVANG